MTAPSLRPSAAAPALAALLLSLCSCAHAPTPAEVFAQGRHGDAIAMLRQRPGETREEDARRVAELRRLSTLLRRQRPGRFHARVLPAAEIERLTGLRPSDAYGRTIVAIEARVDRAARPTYRIFGHLGLSDVAAAAKGLSLHETGYWSAVMDSAWRRAPGEDLVRFSQVGKLCARLWTLPPPPRGKCTGGGRYQPLGVAQVLTGLLLLVTGVTPMVSVVSGSDLVTPMFESKRLPGGEPLRCQGPSRAELAAWERTPPVQATLRLRAMLAEGAPGDDSARVVEVFEWNPGFRSRERVVMPTELALGVALRARTSAGEPVSVSDWVGVPLPPAPSVAEQLERAFGARGVDVSKL